jgi:oxygen-independent coproporphyrinogen-3 oxidase
LHTDSGDGFAGTAVDSIYLGGGTPGLLEQGQLASLLSVVRNDFDVILDAEITLETSPENVTPSMATAWARCGVNRVSIGVQSMVETELRAVGRRHGAATVTGAFQNLREAGIGNISVDLIAGLPHQTQESWQESLEQLVALGPQHFSVYMLEVDENSRLGSQLLRQGSRYGAGKVPSEEIIIVLFRRAMETLGRAGFVHYEISNYALPGKQSVHNEKYWTGAPFYGFGLDAHSDYGDRRRSNTDSLPVYLEKMGQELAPVADETRLTDRHRLEERFFLGLRRRDGITLSQIDQQFGVRTAEQFSESIQRFLSAGWLVAEAEGDRLRLTDEGILFSNEVFAGFIQ